jgi:hypothetical protein
MIVLPTPARHHWLVAFWLVLSLVIGVLFAVLRSLLLSPGSIVSAAVLILVLAAPGLFRPQLALLPYRAWNKLARLALQGFHEVLLRACFYTVFVAARWGGFVDSNLGLARSDSEESMWFAREKTGPAAFIVPRDIGRFAEFVSWARLSGNLWAIALLPSMLLLSLLDTDRRQQKLPDNIYTLF